MLDDTLSYFVKEKSYNDYVYDPVDDFIYEENVLKVLAVEKVVNDGYLKISEKYDVFGQIEKACSLT